MSDKTNNALAIDPNSEQQGPRKAPSSLNTLSIIVGIIALCFVANFILPVLIYSEQRSAKATCANNLRYIGLASIMYSNDYGFFPHMTDADKENSKENISDIYRTLMQGQYLSDSKVFDCPDSLYAPGPQTRLVKDPKEWEWRGTIKPGVWAVLDPGNFDVFNNDYLSYTYQRKMLPAHKARSDTFLAADKAIQRPNSDKGNHVDGYNCLFGDGHVEFIPKKNKKYLDKLFSELRMVTDLAPE